MKNSRKIKTIFFAITCLSVVASDIQVMPSLNWQKQELSTQIHQKVNSVLKSIVKENDYHIDVEILAKESVEPEFYDSQNKNALNSGTKKKDESVINKKKKDENEILEKQAASESAIKFIDEEMSEDSVDVVTFSKFGVEAPLIDDFKDFQPDGKIVLSMKDDSTTNKIDKIEKEFKKKEAALQEKIRKMEVLSSISPIEQVWKYNNSVDIFKSLEAVNIIVRLNSNLAPVTKDAIKKYVSQIKFNLGKVTPSIKFESSLLGANAPVSFLDKVKEIMSYFGPLSIPVAFLLGVILLGMIGKSLLNKYFELSAANQGGLNMKMEGAQSGDKDSDERDDSSATGQPFDGGESSSDEVSGVDRFISFMETSHSEAMMLVKGWIENREDQDSKIALCALVQQTDNNRLAEIFSFLNDREKESWKELIDKPLSSGELVDANKVISSQVVQKIIIPSLISDPDTYDMIVKIQPSQMYEIMKEHENLSALILNVLSPTYLTRVFEHVEEDKVAELLEGASKMSKEDIAESEATLNQVLKKYVQSQSVYPFIDKAIAIVSNAVGDMEEKLYKVILSSTTRARTKEISLLNYPSFLISKLSENATKNLISDYPLVDRVKYLLCVEESEKQRLMSIYAPEGSKAHDLLSIEFEPYNEEANKERLLMEKQQVLKNYYSYVRKELLGDGEMMKEAELVINHWLDDMESATSNDNRSEGHLREVS